MVILKLVGFANGEPCPMAGAYLESYDLDAFDGVGHVKFTKRPERAMKFATFKAAFDAIQTASPSFPLRADGAPNRPLRCSDWEVITYPLKLPVLAL